MKIHKTIMIGLAALAAILLIFGPVFNIDRSFGLLLLVCPLMMLGMMAMMSRGSNDRK